MEKKTRTIGILLLVLLVLLITFFGLKKWNTSKSEAEEKKKENAVVHIFETDSLESIEYKEASGEEMSFVKEDDTWEYAPDTTIALTESSMQNMEDAFNIRVQTDDCIQWCMYFRRKTAFSIVKMLTLNRGSDTLNAERNLYTN